MLIYTVVYVVGVASGISLLWLAAPGGNSLQSGPLSRPSQPRWFVLHEANRFLIRTLGRII
jgi:hypothetical protein